MSTLHPRGNIPPAVPSTTERFDASALMGAMSPQRAPAPASSAVPSSRAGSGVGARPAVPVIEDEEALAALASFESDTAADWAGGAGGGESSLAASGTASSMLEAALVLAEEAVSGDQDDDVDAAMLALTDGVLPFSQEAPRFENAAHSTAAEAAQMPSAPAHPTANVLQASPASNGRNRTEISFAGAPNSAISCTGRVTSVPGGKPAESSLTASQRAALNRARALERRQKQQAARV